MELFFEETVNDDLDCLGDSDLGKDVFHDFDHCCVDLLFVLEADIVFVVHFDGFVKED